MDRLDRRIRAVLAQRRADRRAAQAERRVEANMAREREPAVVIGERHRAAIEAQRRQWPNPGHRR